MTKSLYGAPREDKMEIRRNEEWSEFYKKELDALEWAKEFMDAYERKHKNKSK